MEIARYEIEDDWRRGTSMDTLTLKTTHPCCGGRVRLTALQGVPRERYERKCYGCGWTWTVTRTTVGERDGVRVDRLDWDQLGRI
jgi:hypothetical protein